MVVISNKNLWLVTHFRIISEVEQYDFAIWTIWMSMEWLLLWMIQVWLIEALLQESGKIKQKKNVVIAQKYTKHLNKKKYQSFGTSVGC